jgi:hypothetical protein
MDMKTVNISIEKRIELLSMQNKIDRLEVEMAFDGVVEQLRPSRLIANTLNDVVTSPQLGQSIANVGMSVALGFISKKMAVGDSHNPLKVIMGAMLQYGVTAMVSKNPQKVKLVALNFLQSMLSKLHHTPEKDLPRPIN